jgi:hypothetical protein
MDYGLAGSTPAPRNDNLNHKTERQKRLAFLPSLITSTGNHFIGHF